MSDTLPKETTTNKKYEHNSKIIKNKALKAKEVGPKPIWNKKVPDTEIEKFTTKVNEKYGLQLRSYRDLHRWSVENVALFWEEVWIYFGIVSSKPYDEVFVKTGPGFLDVDWFAGARFNYAENILRIRDNRVAIAYSDEDNHFETVTFAELFEQVKLYASAFRKNGLQKGDRIACYMSNVKEAIYAMLAAASIGAVWGGPQPYYGARAAANIVRMLEPKFLIVVDRHSESKIEYDMIEKLPVIVNNTPSLEKIIIVPTRAATLTKDLSHIRDCHLLEDFLNTGKTPDGTVPDIVFEQLPPSHPVSISFSSGTTGLPKGPVHSAITLLSHMVDIGLHWNLKCGDTLFNPYAMGWTLWNCFVPCLALGVKLFLYNGCPFYADIQPNIWDIMAEHKITYIFLVTCIVDRMEKANMKPTSNAKLDHLKMVTIGGSPVKSQNFDYIRKIAGDNVFVGSMYGSTETSGTFSGCALNLPVYSGEIQVPALGKDVQCFDGQGNSLIGERGEMVVRTPCPSLPTKLWKDEGNKIANFNYFSKYPGVWCQNDEIWINPATKGIIVIGRSDDTITQYGDRFGSGDIYFAIHDMEEIKDYICVGQLRHDGEMRAVLFLKMKEGYVFDEDIKKKVAERITKELWIDCIPEYIGEIKDIPYNLNNKRMESVVRKIVATNQIPEVANIRNPECLKYYCDIPEILNYNKQ